MGRERKERKLLPPQILFCSFLTLHAPSTLRKETTAMQVKPDGGDVNVLKLFTRRVESNFTTVPEMERFLKRKQLKKLP